MKIAILGFDREGRSVLHFIRSHKSLYKSPEIYILDINPKLQIPPETQGILGKKYLDNLEQFDLIFRTPGISFMLPQLQQARKAGVEVSSLMKLFFKHCPGKIIGVTGTKGKGTTSTLIYKILKAAGKNVYLAGNIGKPAIDILPRLKKNSWAVVELSSFQLMDMNRSPHIAVVLMVTSEHLDWHKNVKEYRDAKSQIVRHQSSKDYAVIAQDYPVSMSYIKKTKAQVATFSKHTRVRRGTWVENNTFWFSNGKLKEKIIATKDLKIPGHHNWDNAGAAITTAKFLGIKNEAIIKTTRAFKGLEHRLELVGRINGVRYYNDSYSTTPETAIAAIGAFKQPKVLILGGASKNSDFRQLGKVISLSKTIRAIIGIGKEWPRIKSQIKNKNIVIIEGCKNMKAIVGAAKKVVRLGDVVVLSPACTSFDMFKNYTDRGRQFKQLVKKLEN